MLLNDLSIRSWDITKEADELATTTPNIIARLLSIFAAFARIRAPLTTWAPISEYTNL